MRATVRLCLLVPVFLAPFGLGRASAQYLVDEVGLGFPDRLGGAQMTNGRRYERTHPGYGINSESVCARFGQAPSDIAASSRR